MYRTRNRGRGAGSEGIKGPNSALTQFLREEGISAETIRQKWLDQQKENEEKEAALKEAAAAAETDEKELSAKLETLKKEIEEDDESTSTDEEIFSRKAKLTSVDSDEEEYEEDNIAIPSSRRKSARLHPDDPSVSSPVPQVLPTKKRKRTKTNDILSNKVARLPTLQYLCISTIGENILRLQKEAEESEIDDTSTAIYSKLREALGGISIDNLSNLANTLSKNRALADSTLQLFLKTELSSLTFNDCSKVSYEGYKALAIFCPHITELTLNMCGQLNNESLLFIADKLTKLTSITLDGPFLINEATWDEFFTKMNGKLEKFHVSNTHRFTDFSLSSLLRNCGESLQSLHFCRLDSVSNYALLPQYLRNENFHTLEIIYPYNEEDVTNELIINLLGQIGSSIKVLSLDGCQGLTDEALINGLCTFCQDNNGIEKLSFEDLDQITTAGLSQLFETLQLPNLKSVNLKRCIQISDQALIELLTGKAKDSLEELNLNSMKELTATAFEHMYCPKLKKLDAGFVRCVNDKVVETLQKNNLKLSTLIVFGDNLVTSKLILRQGLTLIGRQSDSL